MKIGRNDMCPRGSGMKYKKCCEADPCRKGNLLRALKLSKTKEDIPMILNQPVFVYVFKVELIDGRMFDFSKITEKEIWRIIEVRGDQTLHALHREIQNAFDWDNDHLYSFYMSKKRRDRENEYAGSPIGYQESSFMTGPKQQAVDTEIRDLNLNVRRQFRYLFDYGDDIIHKITLTKIIRKPDLNIKYPRVTEVCGKAPYQYGEAVE